MYNYRSTPYTREYLPQIHKQTDFVNWLKKNKIPFEMKNESPKKLSPIQLEFDPLKVQEIANSDEVKPIITSIDKFILDGHHRWAACRNQKTIPVIMVHEPIHALVPTAKRYESSTKLDIMKKTVLESINNKQKNLKRSIRYEQITIID